MNKEEVMKILKDFHGKSALFSVRTALETLHPELRENEDEKIRKELIEHVKDQQSSFISAPDCRDKYEEEENNKYNSWLAWLEKQGEHKLPIEKLPEEMKTIGESLEFTTQEECDEYNQMVSGLIMSDDNKEEQKQNVDNKKLTDVNHEYFSELLENDDSKDINDYAYQVAYCMSHDWLEETATWEDVQKAVKLGAEWQKQKLTWSEEDEEIRKWIINEIKIKHHNLDEDNVDFVDKAIAWLEKQGKEDSSIQQAYEWGYTEGKRIERKHWIEKQNFSEDYNSIDPQFGKPINKVEPKFKDGDWVVFNDKHESVYQIEKIENFQYILRHILGGSMPLSFSGEDMIRPWTIQDARLGDVLANCNIICIYKKRESEHLIKVYLNYSLAECVEITDDTIGDFNLYPATKEQRDTLFTKMKEAGYEWDAEKKELKKVEKKSQRMISAEAKEAMYDKPTDEDMKEALRTEYEKGRADAFAQMQKEWSEEDEKMIGRVRGIIEAYAFSQSAVDVNGDLCEKEYIDTDNWLKSLKERYTWKPSSELDETSYQVGIKRVLENPESYGLTKYNWKPSDEQIEALGVATNICLIPEKQYDELNKLYYDLKKLKGE